MEGASVSSLTRVLSRLLPTRTAFVIAASLKFLPHLLAEIKKIYEAQLLRGARILPRDMVWPGNWREILHCLVAPAVVQALELADDIARAARAREFGRYPKRTSWPADRETCQ